jgi:hypothetical protein
VVGHEYDLIAGRMPVGLELVRELRHHPNVDYLEPIFPGTRWQGGRGPAAAGGGLRHAAC